MLILLLPIGTGSTTNLVSLTSDLIEKFGLENSNAGLSGVDGSSLTPRHVTMAGSGEVLVMTQCG